MQICRACGTPFTKTVVIDGKRLDFRGRKHCLTCRPHRPLAGPRKSVPRRTQLKTCERCGTSFPAKIAIDGKTRSLYRRHFCLECSPFGAHNTSKTPPGTIPDAELIEHRRRRRNAKTYRYQKKQRKQLKLELMSERGGQCEACGYRGSIAALEFHHRDPRAKEFRISSMSVSRARLWLEAAKCELLCANCHRARHIATSSREQATTVGYRRRLKRRAVEHLGGLCAGCARSWPHQVFEFHHLDSTTKNFGISEDGIARSWEKTERELQKCVLLCANCHREVHAGARRIEEGLPGLAEATHPYAA